MYLPDKVLIALAAILPSQIEKPRVQLDCNFWKTTEKASLIVHHLT
jgi:hypothetical protein